MMASGSRAVRVLVRGGRRPGPHPEAASPVSPAGRLPYCSWFGEHRTWNVGPTRQYFQAILGAEGRLLTTDEAAAILHVSRRRLYAIIAAGELGVYRLNRTIRVSPADLSAYLERRRSEGDV